MLKIGLTGGIATGKSTVSRMIQDLGIPVIDADQLAKEAVETGEPALLKIVDTFGSSVLFDDGSLNRKKLGAIIFNDDDKRNQLNNIVHPEVRRRMKAAIQNYEDQQEPAVVLDIPLLFESKLTNWVDRVLLVYTNPSIQLARLMERDQTDEDEALSRIRSQIPIEKKRRRAEAVIDNSGSLSETHHQLEVIFRRWSVLDS